MARVSLETHMKEERAEEPEEEQGQVGPFIAISRQYGCYGFSLGLLLMEILNEDVSAEATWKIYHREILERLANETNTATELLERQRRAKPGLMDVFRSLSKEKVPSGYKIRKRIATIIRGLAIDGYAIIIGQGGALATQGLPNGLSVRLEGPEDWRVKEVAFRDGLSETKARMRIRAKERDRDYLRKLYMNRQQIKLTFGLTYDCSTFTLAQIAQQIVYAMKLKACI